MTRLFIALPVNGIVRESLKPTFDFLMTHEHLIKTVSPENYHITVKFLGECDGNVAKAIESTFMEIATPTGEIPFTLRGLGTFPDSRRPTVVWAGLITDMEKFTVIHKNVEKFAANFRFREEKRDFTPHLTVARVKSGRKITGDLMKYIEKNKDTNFGDSFFKRLSLFSSRLTPDGPIYSELSTITF